MRDSIGKIHIIKIELAPGQWVELITLDIFMHRFHGMFLE